MKRLKTHTEAYEVRLDYPKPDGTWVCSHKEIVVIKLPLNERGKDRHDEAEAIAKKKFPKCEIRGVTYL